MSEWTGNRPTTLPLYKVLNRKLQYSRARNRTKCYLTENRKDPSKETKDRLNVF
jgi:hypothetical protein